MEKTKLALLMKQYPVAKLATGNIRTCPVRLSFPSLFEKTSFEGSEPKYSTVLLFPKGADLSILKTEAGTLVKANSKGGAVHNPFRNQGEKQLAGYEDGAIFMTVSTTQRPGVLGIDGKPVLDQEDVYPGVWALVTIRPFWFDAKVKKGVSFGLQNVRLIANDEPFSGGAPADEEFADIDNSMSGENAFADAGTEDFGLG